MSLCLHLNVQALALVCRQSYFRIIVSLLIVVEGAQTPAGGRDL